MATHDAPFVPLGEAGAFPNAASQRQWQRPRGLSSFADRAESYLAKAGHDRGPWLIVAFAAGIAAWFQLSNASEWVFAMALVAGAAATAWLHWRRDEHRELLRTWSLRLPCVSPGGLPRSFCDPR
ncbi:hypothetical protein [Qipengyuania sp.]|uniref:hypothetical protein n=1 Tax=Qipengyuania sp. TaxID=2004515 RepID=UPI0035C7F41D